MHVTIWLEGKPIIILSESLTEKLTLKMKKLVQKRHLENKEALNRYIHLLWDYTTLVPGQGHPIDIEFLFEKHPDELEIFITLLKEAFQEVQKAEPVKEAHVVQAYIDLLSEYLAKLRNQSHE